MNPKVRKPQVLMSTGAVEDASKKKEASFLSSAIEFYSKSQWIEKLLFALTADFLGLSPLISKGNLAQEHPKDSPGIVFYQPSGHPSTQSSLHITCQS